MANILFSGDPNDLNKIRFVQSNNRYNDGRRIVVVRGNPASLVNEGTQAGSGSLTGRNQNNDENSFTRE